MQVIFNADDFGLSHEVNMAVTYAHREGVLTSASLMVTGEAMEEAVILAKEMPSLAVGLHLVLARGKAVLPPGECPRLLDGRGYFAGTPLSLGLRILWGKAARRELANEMEAQFERFAATGLPLSHVDSHLHMHMHPTVFNLLLPLAEAYGAAGIRVPRDDLQLALRHDRKRMGDKVLWAIVFGVLSRWARKRLAGSPLVACERVYGLMYSGEMATEYVVEVLKQLKGRSAELYFHPTMSWKSEALGPNPGDLSTLISPVVRDLIHDRGLCLATYPSLRGER